MGALSPFNLERALVEQVEAKLFEVFSWSDGKFMFKAGDAAVGERTGCSNGRPRRRSWKASGGTTMKRASRRCWRNTTTSTCR